MSTLIFTPSHTTLISDYSFLAHLEKLYGTPWGIMTNFQMPLCKKRERLMRWYNERIKFVLEYGREFDFQIDVTLQDIEHAIAILKRIETALEEHLALLRAGKPVLLL